MAEFVMPKLGADMSAGTLTAWRKQAGETVHRGDIIAEVETEKGNIDVEVFADGTLEKILIEPGEKVPVGTVMALIRDDSAAPRTGTAPLDTHELQPKLAEPQRPKIVPARRTEQPADRRLAISPSARRLARELGVDPATVQGTGHGGAITREDIEQAVKGAAPAAPPVDRAARLRQTIAATMSRSKREIPHYYLSTTVDMHRALEWLGEQNASRPVAERILYGAVILKAVASALREVPELNATWQNNQVALIDSINVGVAISLRQGGLVAPALHDTDKLTLEELMRRMRDLVNRTRSGSLRSSEMSDPTITVTNLGEQGVESVYAVIYPPQVAMVGVGKIIERPWCVDGQIVPRRVVTMTLAADHRVSDGHRGGVFLTALDRLLQHPEKL